MDIIIAEDNPVSAKLMQKMLNTDGKLHSASNGNDALELLKKTDSRIIISDWMMPRMDGITLCKKIREEFSSTYIYIILLTSKSDIDDAISAFEAGADDYIIKPFNPKELNARITVGKRIIDLQDKYEQATVQLLNSEKMAAVGQLSAGIAHEINNPIGFVKSNLKSLESYLHDLGYIFRKLKNIFLLNKENRLPDKDQLNKIKKIMDEKDTDFMMEDIPDLLKDCIEGTDRVSKIVTDMKNFAHPGSSEPKLTDINNSIETTLNVIWNDLKYKAEVIKEYSDLPKIKCFPQQLNQVFMNILLNSVQAIEDKGTITVTTKTEDNCVVISFADTGSGISPDNLSKIFDPFFTTKPVGKGTGLGLNVAYNIIKRHNGTINAWSTQGKGTVFTISLPLDENLKQDGIKYEQR
ncbi:MAG: response regulator [Thermodesulfobacteriota bacterium]